MSKGIRYDEDFKQSLVNLYNAGTSQAKLSRDYGVSATSLEQVKLSCFEYIESFYNNYNPHSANDGLTPNEKEDIYFNQSRSF